MRSEKKQEEVKPAEEKLEDLNVIEQQAKETKAGAQGRVVLGTDQGIWRTENDNSLSIKN